MTNTLNYALGLSAAVTINLGGLYLFLLVLKVLSTGTGF